MREKLKPFSVCTWAHRCDTLRSWATSTVSATIRNNGHVNPEACYFERGPFSVQDILDSRMVADPFHLLDCATASEGGCGIVLTRADGKSPRSAGSAPAPAGRGGRAARCARRA